MMTKEDTGPDFKFTYNELEFEGYAEPARAKSTLEYTVYYVHDKDSHVPFKYRWDWEIAVDEETREDEKRFIEENSKGFPEHLKPMMFKEIIQDLVELAAIVYGANTNRTEFKFKLPHGTEYKSISSNNEWPVITEESVKAYYERKGIKPFLNFDGSRNPEVAY